MEIHPIFDVNTNIPTNVSPIAPTTSPTSSHNSVAAQPTRKILFVAPATCGQLQITKYFWEFYKPASFEAEFAALETCTINPLMETVMKGHDLHIQQNEVDSLFVLATTSKNFEYIVSLGGFQHYGSISPFVETLRILFGKAPKRVCWEIPNPEALNISKSDQLHIAENIRDRIEFEVAQFSQSLEEEIVN